MATALETSPLAIDAASQARAEVRPNFSLPSYYYTSEERFQQDMAVMRETMWLAAGHESQIRQQGDYLLFDVGGESIIIIRGKEGAIHAYFNVCRHRGSQICTEHTGNAKLLVCPYHAWTYRLDGRLLPPRSMPKSFDPKEYSLTPCHVRSLDGILFVCLASGSPPDWEEFAGPLRPHIAAYGIARTKVIVEEHMYSDANWKIVQENMFECYHCPGVHKDLARITPPLPPAVAYVDPNGETNEQRLVRLGRALEPLFQGSDVPAMSSSILVELGDGRVSATMDGSEASMLLGDLTDYSGAWTLITFNPHSHAVIFDDYVQILTYTPLGVERSDSAMFWLVHEDAVEGENYDLDKITELFRITMTEDIKVTDDMQRGVRSVAYRPGPHALEESRVSDYDDWYIRHFVDAVAR